MSGRSVATATAGRVAAGLLATAVGTATAGPVSPTSLEDARLLLTRYAEQSYLQSADMADLYSEAAWIRVRVADGAVRTFRGKAFKQGIRQALEAHTAGLDTSQFRDATVERHGSRLVIHAKRYAANRCYWDPGYTVELEREAGQWLIVAETLALRPQARCAPETTTASAPPAVAVRSTVAVALPPLGPEIDPLAGLDPLALTGGTAPLDPRIEEVLRIARDAATTHAAPAAAAVSTGAPVPEAATADARSLWVTPK